MRLGVLDVGSNTVHFVVVDAHRGGHPTPMNDSKTRLRLIEYLDDDNNISKTGIARLVDAVNEAADLAKAMPPYEPHPKEGVSLALKGNPDDLDQ